MNTPVVFLIFNRPDLTEQVFQAIAQAKPNRLLVVADGPRNENERVLCEQAREIIKKVDWPCEVQTNFSETNLGCKKRVSSGLDWAFSLVEEAIILEDDCLPHPDFFRFCEEMLDRYRDDERIMHITGDRFLPRDEKEASHYFSRHIHVWGWATWKRGWKYYDIEMTQWKTQRENVLAQMSGPLEAQFYARMFDDVASGRTDTWDIQWMLTCWVQSGLSVIPHVNLISNIGFREDATHTKDKTIFAQFAVYPLDKTLAPTAIFPDRLNDERILQMSLSQIPSPTIAQKIKNRLKRL